MPVAATQTSYRRSTPSRGRIVVGPEDHGRRMRLADFARADVIPGYHYELARGVVQVTNIPSWIHNRVCDHVHGEFHFYRREHPGVIQDLAANYGSKIELWGSQTERHPDLSVYLTAPPEDNLQPWDIWIPDIVIEVVSPSSARRDYDEKPADYLAAGVREYWIIDPQKRCGLFRVRRADTWIEKRIGARGKWRTALLPGFTLEMAKVFARLPKHK